jgi:hypothetical protein
VGIEGSASFFEKKEAKKLLLGGRLTSVPIRSNLV